MKTATLCLVPCGLAPLNEGFSEWAGSASRSTGCAMTCQELPPESLGPCPIAGERPIAAMSAKVVAQLDTVFIANLPSSRVVEHEPLQAPAPALSLTAEPS